MQSPFGRAGVMYTPSAYPDFDALRNCWHPVALSDTVKETIFAGRLLTEKSFSGADAEGVPHAMADLCVHRGTALSIGEIVGNEIQCAYHGCGFVLTAPAHYSSAVGPKKHSLQGTRQFVPLQGALRPHRVSFNEPRWPLPEVPEWRFRRHVVTSGPYVWNADASRQLDEFTDLVTSPGFIPACLAIPNVLLSTSIQ